MKQITCIKENLDKWYEFPRKLSSFIDKVDLVQYFEK